MSQTHEKAAVSVDFSQPSKGLRPFWNATGYANADLTYVPAFRRMYDYLSSYHNHMKYMRLHNILTLHGQGDRFIEGWNGNRLFEFGNRYNGDDKVVTIAADGNLQYDWSNVDRVYDIIVGHGMKPIAELVYLPTAIRKSAEEFYVPGDYRLYGQVIEAFVRHCMERYGLEEIRTWYFEIWNEPDNKPAWCEDPSTFLAMYDYAEHAVHSVDEKLRIGGPATMQFDEAYVLFERFLRHCDHELNYCTGKFGTRLDFISVHCKGGWKDSFCPSTDIMFSALRRYMDIIEKYPAFRGIEFFNDESDIVWSGNAGISRHSWLNFRNTHYAPGFVCKMVSRYCTEIADSGVNLAIVDSDNSHLQWETELFGGKRSQLTPLCSYPARDVLKKPFFNAYVLLARLGDRRWDARSESPDFGKKFGVLPTARGDVLSVMVWNFEDGMEEDVGARTVTLQLDGLKQGGSLRVAEYRIDALHSNSYTGWRAMGAPGDPTEDQIAALRNTADLELGAPVRDAVPEDGKLTLELELPQHAVSLVLIAPQNGNAPAAVRGLSAQPEQGYRGNKQVFLKWTPSTEPDFLYYRVLRAKNGGEFEIISDRLSLNTATFVDMDVKEGDRCIYCVRAVNLSMMCAASGEEAVAEIC